MLSKLYETGYDLHVANYVAYAHSDNKLYEDADHKKQAAKSDVERAFKMGRLLILDGAKYYLPVALLTTGVVVYNGTAAATYAVAADPA